MHWQEIDDDLAYPVPDPVEKASPKKQSRLPKARKPPKPKEKPRPKILDHRAPCVTDPIWEEWSAPILEYITEPKTWDQLETWRKKVKIEGSLLRHVLAWLEENDLARAFFVQKVIVWGKTRRPSSSPP